MITTAAHIAQTESATAIETLNLDHEQTQQLIHAFSDPDMSLRDIAEQFHTTTQALSLFTARPDIQEQLDAIDQLAARRVRIFAARTLPGVIKALEECVRSVHWEETHVTIDRNSEKALDQRRRTREEARKAATLLHKLANFQIKPATKRTARQLSAFTALSAPPREHSLPSPRETCLSGASARASAPHLLNSPT